MLEILLEKSASFNRLRDLRVSLDNLKSLMAQLNKMVQHFKQPDAGLSSTNQEGILKTLRHKRKKDNTAERFQALPENYAELIIQMSSLLEGLPEDFSAKILEYLKTLLRIFNNQVEFYSPDAGNRPPLSEDEKDILQSRLMTQIEDELNILTKCFIGETCSVFEENHVEIALQLLELETNLITGASQELGGEEDDELSALFSRQEARRPTPKSAKKPSSTLIGILEKFNQIIQAIKAMKSRGDAQSPEWMQHFLTQTSLQSLLEACCFKNLKFDLRAGFTGKVDAQDAYQRYFTQPLPSERQFIEECLKYMIQAFLPNLENLRNFKTCLSFVIAHNPTSSQSRYILFLPDGVNIQRLKQVLITMTRLIRDSHQVQINIVDPGESPESKAAFERLTGLLMHSSSKKICAEVNWMRFLMKLKALYGAEFDNIQFRGVNLKLTNTIFNELAPVEAAAPAEPAKAAEEVSGDFDKKFMVEVDDRVYTVEEFLPCELCCERTGIMTSVISSTVLPMPDDMRDLASPMMLDGEPTALASIARLFAPLTMPTMAQGVVAAPSDHDNTVASK